MNLIHTIVLAIIEGLTEFLPVSSTGHMIIASTFMGIASDPFVKLFTVAIQLGAIMSVVVLYWRNFLQNFEFYIRLAVAFLPAVVFGLLFKKQIDGLLENIVVVAIALLVGGIIFLFIDEFFEKNERRQTDISDVNYMKALKIGMFQVISMVPGVSRAAATLIGGLSQGLNRKTAAEFSFFLAVPTMFGATAKSLWDYFKDEGGSFTGDQITLLIVGNVIAFLVGMLAIKSFIRFLTKNGLKVFGYYRIAVGLLLIGLWAMGYFDTLDMSKF